MNTGEIDVGPDSDQIQHSFILRIWWEAGEDPKNGEWRGFIEYVNFRKQSYFRGMHTLPRIIDRLIEKKIS